MFIYKKKIGDGIKEDIADEIHKPLRRNFQRRKVLTIAIDDLWQADLVEMITNQDKGYKHILTVIDVFSKFAWAIPIKNKTGESVSTAFKSIITNRSPTHLQTDRGLEFYNKIFQQLMHDNKIIHYSTYSEVKASVAERFNRTLKEKMWKRFTVNGNYKWFDLLPQLVEEYNNTIHSTIKMTPVQGSMKENEKSLKKNFAQTLPTKPPKFKINDKVRISRYKTIFAKGYTPNWSNEIFTVCKIIYSDPITYHIKDYENKLIEGCFYEQEMSKTKYPNVFLVEKVIRRKGNKVFVKWLGFDNTHNTWIEKDAVIN